MKFEYNAEIRISGVVEAETEDEARSRIYRLISDTMLADTDELELDNSEVMYINEKEG